MRDYLEDENGDLLIQNGDFVKGDAREKHINDRLTATKGSIRQHPLAGLDGYRFKNKTGIRAQLDFEREAKAELEDDGFTGVKLSFNDGLSDLIITTD